MHNQNLKSNHIQFILITYKHHPSILNSKWNQKQARYFKNVKTLASLTSTDANPTRTGLKRRAPQHDSSLRSW